MTRRPRPLSQTGEAYAVVTLHRPATVDDRQALGAVVRTLVDISNRLDIVFPMHPRTAGNLERFELLRRYAARAASV